MSQVPYQLLELTVISAQDLAPAKNLRTYAVTWIKPDRKLRTRVDTQGRNNPTWNDKFVFRTDEKFLDSETSFVIIEIYATGWIKDSLIGSVRVMISNLIPPSVRQEKRFVALQIRRPSGRPQGIVNLGVSLLDNTMRSMPLCTELTGSTVGFRDLWKDKKGENDGEEEKRQTLAKLLRSLSDKTDLTTKQGNERKKKIGSVCNGSLLQYGPGSIAATDAGLGSVIDNVFGNGAVNAAAGGGGGGSMVNGSMCNSDVGPSPSVVAAAVAMGLYPLHQGPPPRRGARVLEDWTVEESEVGGLKTRIDRWRMDLPPGYERLEDAKKERKRRHQRRRRRMSDDEEEDDGRFTCFGAALGFEFKIVCGGGKNIKKKGGKKK